MHLSYYDITDEHDNPLGFTASDDEVHEKELWRRSVHIIIYTPDKQIVMQKRAPNLNYYPNKIEISVGGGVDAGETPEEAIVREVQEELGITIDSSDLHFIGKTKYNHRFKTGRDKSFIYSYSICVPADKLTFRSNQEETSAVFLLSEQELREAIDSHYVPGIGKLVGLYAYWKYLLDAI